MVQKAMLLFRASAETDMSQVNVIDSLSANIAAKFFLAQSSLSDQGSSIMIFLVPQPGYYDPMINPAYVWQGWEPRQDLAPPLQEEEK